MLGTKILEELNSKVNGKLVVVRDLAWGTHIMADGLTQSGGIVDSIWKRTLKKVKTKKQTASSVLILGLGGGSVAKQVRKYWPTATIAGVEIDPVMVGLGKKYLDLDKLAVNISIVDAAKFKLANYDLILVDLYCGSTFPEVFETNKFLTKVVKSLASDGVVVFNRLYYGLKRSQAVKFGIKLEKFFNEVEVFYPEANVMYICEAS